MVEGRQVFNRQLREYQDARRGANGEGLPEPPVDLVEKLQGLADLRSSYDRDAAGFVFDDVYHLAFHMLRSWRPYGRPIPPAPDCSRLYRGQLVDDWGVGAKICRGLPDRPDRDDELCKRATTACMVGHAIATKRQLPFAEAMAVAQHYSAEDVLGVPTWLVDFSRDPWVALFFASDGGKTGEVGIVWDIAPKEYANHAAGEDNPIGSLQLVVPRDVLRIDNQAGVFIIAGLPQIFDQYVASGWHTRFQQHTGLRFEDPVLGICEGVIYPQADPLLKELPEILQSVVDCRCKRGKTPCDVPPAVFTDPLDPKTYERLLTCWLNQVLAGRANHLEISRLQEAFVDLARFHARLHSAPYVGGLPNIVSRSLNRLRHAFEILYSQQSRDTQVSVRTAVNQSYVNQMLGARDHVAVLLKALKSIAPNGDILPA